MSKGKRRVPKLRFPGFTEDWEQRKLGNLATVEMNKRIFKEQTTTKGEIPFYKIGTFGSDADSFISKELFEEYKNKYPYPNIGDILISASGSIGRTVVYNGEDAYYQDSNIVWLNHNGQIDNSFLLQFYNQVKWAGLEGSTIKRLYNKNILETNIALPKIEEQRLIGKFFKLVDSSITLHQRKLDNLKLKKKALLQKLFPKNGERYPELRFPGFTDAWEQRKLGEIFEYLQNNTLSRDSLNYKNPNIKNIHYGDILVKFDEILDGSNKDIPYINSELDLSKFSKSLLRDGDVIFSDTAEDDTVGKAIELQNVNEPFILSGLHTIPCRPLITFGKGYLGNFLNSGSYRMQLRPLVQGIKVSSISKSALKDTMIEYPKNLDEQEKIGSLFYHIAKMITLHQRKLDHLKLQKKALLQQMFV